MARTDNLTNFLTDVAGAIRTKKGTTNPILASDFDTEIANLPSGGGATITKGLVINSYDEDGYATDASIVGMTEIPGYFMYYAMNVNTSGDYTYESVFARIRGDLHLPKNLTKIGTFAFASCATLALKSLPENVSSLGIRTFGNCTNLALESLPEGLTSIPERCFYACPNIILKSLPSKIKSIGPYAFSSCTKLALESLPEGLTSIATNAFYNCPTIKVKRIPSGVTQLTAQTFYGCTGLTEMTIEGNITSIGQKSFYNCTNLEKVILPNVTMVPTLANKDVFTNTPIASGTGNIYVPDELVDTFKAATNWSTYADQIKGIIYLNPETAPSVLLLHAEDFTDSSINNLTINNNNVSIVDGGKFGKCFYNDSTNYVETTLPNALGNNFTIDFWIKLNAYPTISEKFAVPFSIGEYNDGVYFQLETSTTSKKLYVWLGNKNNSIDADKIPLNTWTHLAVTFDGKKYDFYLNGERQFELENIVHTSQVNLNLFRSGGSVTLGRHFKGYIDEVKIVEAVRWTDNFTPPAEPYS